MSIRDDLAAPGTRATVSPVQAEKDQAVAMARRALAMTGPVGSAVGDVQVLARQLLRALALRD